MDKTDQQPVSGRRLKWALMAYGAIAILAGLTLEGRMLEFILILLAALAFKSWVAVKRETTS